VLGSLLDCICFPVSRDELFIKLDIRSVERDICPIVALYLLRFTLVSYDFLQPMFSNSSLKISTFGLHDIVGHVAVRPAIYGVL